MSGLKGAEIAQDHEALLADIVSTETGPNRAAFWWMGQHTFIVKAGDRVIYIDPWFPDWESRQTRPLLTPLEAQFADLALITHGHADHLCPETLPFMVEASPNALFVGPCTEKERLLGECRIPSHRLNCISAGDTVTHKRIRVTAVKSKHEMFDEHPTLGFPYLGYVVEVNGVTFYHAGDTIPYEGMLTTLKKWPHFDALFLPINGRDATRFLSGCAGNLTFQESVELAGDLEPSLVVPAHYDMFIGNQEDPDKFVDFLKAKYPAVPYWVGAAGTRVEIGRGR
jgi:L-ascorbate metabolism protein UlaG (beta-lactamase superfamily)